MQSVRHGNAGIQAPPIHSARGQGDLVRAERGSSAETGGAYERHDSAPTAAPIPRKGST